MFTDRILLRVFLLLLIFLNACQAVKEEPIVNEPTPSPFPTFDLSVRAPSPEPEVMPLAEAQVSPEPEMMPLAEAEVSPEPEMMALPEADVSSEPTAYPAPETLSEPLAQPEALLQATAYPAPSPSPEPTAYPSPSATSVEGSATPSPTASATATPTATATGSVQPTFTSSPTASATAIPTPTLTPTGTASVEPTPLARATAQTSLTPTGTASAQASLTPTGTASAQGSVSATGTPSVQASVTLTATASIQASLTPTGTASISVTATSTPLIPGSVTATGTPSLQGRVTPIGTPPVQGSVTPIGTPSVQGSVTPIGTPSVQGSVTATGTPSVQGSVTPIGTPPVQGSVTPIGTPPVQGSVTPMGTPPLASPTVSGLPGLAPVSKVEIERVASKPAEVVVIATGNLPDQCHEISEVTNTRQGNSFQVTINTIRFDDGQCIQQITPFEQQVALDVNNLPAGSYTVTVNQASGMFDLAANPPTPESVPSGLPVSCQRSTQEAQEKALYINPTDGYCFTYPSGFTIADVFPTPVAGNVNANQVKVYGPALDGSAEPLAARLTIHTQPIDPTWSLDQTVNACLSDLSGPPATRETVTLGNQPAQIVSGIPGLTAERQLFSIYNHRLYALNFYPVDSILFPQAQADVEALSQSVMSSFAFLPQPFIDQFAACPKATEDSPAVTPEYCLLYPQNFRLATIQGDAPNQRGGIQFKAPPQASDPQPHPATLTIQQLDVVGEGALPDVIAGVLNEVSNLGVTQTQTTIDGIPAIVVDGIPAQTLTRQAYVLHNNNLYQFTLTPANEPLAADAQALWQKVIDSFTFLQK